MGATTDVVTLLQSQWGWLVTLAVFLYQLFWPLWETKMQTVVNGVETKIDNVYDEVRNLEEKQVSHIQVTRAMASTNPRIDDESVDECLVDNGVNPDDFLIGVRADGGEDIDENEDDT